MNKTNDLAGQTSPYLLQHVLNPVNWQPWGEAALAQARREDKPIFLSIGYAACHWCHVMERESFEDEAIAAFLNERFVSIKVDREERPDIDAIYMNAVQLLTGAGGWPLTAFLTPDLRPFAGGTYFPPETRYGRIGFKTLLERVTEAWGQDRDRVMAAGSELTTHLQRIAADDHGPAGGEVPGRGLIERAVGEMNARFDDRHGGFGGAPKFPPDTALALLLRRAEDGDTGARQIAERTLDAMARGGIYDHVGGGFARYSVDELWLVPHFEKMLYNQALLVPAYADAARLTGRDDFRRVVEQTLDFVRRELTDPAGGFWSSLDADSEGVEGRFYIWDRAEIETILGDEAGLFLEAYGISDEGNFEGRNIPNLLHGGLGEQAASHGTDEAGLEGRLVPLRQALLDARAARVRPATDDKVLTGWNGLMITAFARAHQVFAREEDLESAQRAAAFALDQLLVDGRLKATWRNSRASLNGYLDDYAFLGRALLDLYETDFDRRWFDASAALAHTMLDHFLDDERGGFYFTSDDHEELLTRNRSTHDGALPSGAGVAAGWLLRLDAHLNDTRLAQAGRATLIGMRPAAEQAPSAFSALLAAADWNRHDLVQVAIAGETSDPATRRLVAAVRERLPAWTTLAAGSGTAVEGLPLFDGRSPGDDGPQAYVCRERNCRAPVSGVDELVDELERARDDQ